MTDSEPSRTVVLVPANEVRDDVPRWAWEHDGAGRIPLGAITLFAGRPGAGKSSAARWMAAAVTRGTLPGAWYGTPRPVAYVIGEEPRAVVKSGLRAAGADLDLVHFPEVRFGADTAAMRAADVDELADVLAAAGVGLVVADPLMSTIDRRTDVHRNNDVRAVLDPWRRLAERIDGVVLGVAHLNKSGSTDLVAGITGSSAFGEVPRAVFGFAVDKDGTRVLTQAKNSLGPDGLSLVYSLTESPITTDTGRSGTAVRFGIVGPSDRSVADILRDAVRDRGEPRGSRYEHIASWLRDTLAEPMLANDLYALAEDAGYSRSQLRRANNTFNVAEPYRPTNPGPSWWRLLASPSPHARANTPAELSSAVLCEVDATKQHIPPTTSPEHMTAHDSSPGVHARELSCATDASTVDPVARGSDRASGQVLAAAPPEAQHQLPADDPAVRYASQLATVSDRVLRHITAGTTMRSQIRKKLSGNRLADGTTERDLMPAAIRQLIDTGVITETTGSPVVYRLTETAA